MATCNPQLVSDYLTLIFVFYVGDFNMNSDFELIQDSAPHLPPENLSLLTIHKK